MSNATLTHRDLYARQTENTTMNADMCALCNTPLGTEPTVGGRWAHERCQAERINWRADHPTGESYPLPATYQATIETDTGPDPEGAPAHIYAFTRDDGTLLDYNTSEVIGRYDVHSIEGGKRTITARINGADYQGWHAYQWTLGIFLYPKEPQP